jgi:hypothetical protein
VNERNRKCMEAVDAMFFSGDMLWQEDERQEVKVYLERWTRAMAKREADIAEDAEKGGE